MNNPFETLIVPGGILLLGFLSALLLPAPAFSVTVAQHLLQMFHLQDLNQLYTVVFCVWFLLLGTIEFFCYPLCLASLVQGLIACALTSAFSRSALRA